MAAGQTGGQTLTKGRFSLRGLRVAAGSVGRCRGRHRHRTRRRGWGVRGRPEVGPQAPAVSMSWSLAPCRQRLSTRSSGTTATGAALEFRPGTLRDANRGRHVDVGAPGLDRRPRPRRRGRRVPFETIVAPFRRAGRPGAPRTADPHGGRDRRAGPRSPTRPVPRSPAMVSGWIRPRSCLADDEPVAEHADRGGRDAEEPFDVWVPVEVLELLDGVGGSSTSSPAAERVRGADGPAGVHRPGGSGGTRPGNAGAGRLRSDNFGPQGLRNGPPRF